MCTNKTDGQPRCRRPVSTEVQSAGRMGIYQNEHSRAKKEKFRKCGPIPRSVMHGTDLAQPPDAWYAAIG